MVGEVTPVNVKVLFFASAREAAGESAADCQVHSGTPDTAALRKMLAEKYPKLQLLVTLQISKKAQDAGFVSTGIS